MAFATPPTSVPFPDPPTNTRREPCSEQVDSAREMEGTSLSEEENLPTPFPDPPGINGKTWTTREEYEFLKAKVPEYNEHQAAGTLDEFWPSLHHAYFAEFDFPQRLFQKPNNQLSKGEQTVVGRRVNARHTQLGNWFRNNGRDSRQRGQGIAGGVLQSFHKHQKKRTRAPKAVEVYSALYYRDAVDNPVQRAINAEVGEKQPGETSKQYRARKLNSYRTHIEEAWENASPEQKARVESELEKERQRIKQEKECLHVEQNTTDLAVQRVVCLKQFHNVAGEMLRALHERTGLHLCLIAAGVKWKDAAVRVQSIHVGQNAEGKDFGQVYGGYNELITKPFQAFTRTCIDSNQRDKIFKENAAAFASLKEFEVLPGAMAHESDSQPPESPAPSDADYEQYLGDVNGDSQSASVGQHHDNSDDGDEDDNITIRAPITPPIADSIPPSGSRDTSQLAETHFDENLLHPDLRPSHRLVVEIPARSHRDHQSHTIESGSIQSQPTSRGVTPEQNSRQSTPDFDISLLLRDLHPNTPDFARRAINWFNSLELGPGFVACVFGWLDLEDSLEWEGTGKNLPLFSDRDVGCRPSQLEYWMKRGRDYNKRPPIEDIQEYRSQLQAWWLQLQPEWRKPNDGSFFPLKRYEALDEWGWAPLACLGKDGIFTLLVALAWWGCVGDEKDGCLWETLTSDVAKSFEAMVACNIVNQEREREAERKRQEAERKKEHRKRKACNTRPPIKRTKHA